MIKSKYYLIGKNMKILLIFPPVASPVSPYLSTPLLAGQLTNAGYDTDILDLSVEFFEYVLNKDLLLNSYTKAKNELLKLQQITKDINHSDVIENPSKYNIEIKKAVEKQRYFEFFIKNDEENLDIIENINKYVQSYKNKEIFYNISQMDKVALKVQNALSIAMLPYFPYILNFNLYQNPTYKFNYKAIKHQIFNDDKNQLLNDFYKQKIKEHNLEQYDFICISCPNETQILPSLALTKILKETTKIKIAIGGNIISRIDDYLKTIDEAFEIFYDYLIIGCGEESIVKLTDYINGKNIKLDKIKGLIYKKDNKIHQNKPNLEYKINNTVQMSLKGLDLNKYFTPDIIMPIQSSKGCYWGKCLFCGLHYPPKKYSVKKPSKVVDEIEYLNKNYDIKIFEFIDEALHPKYLEKLADELLKRNLDIKYVCCARLENKFYNSKLAEKLYNSGLRLIEFGFETDSKRIFNKLNKGINFEKRLKVVEYMANANIWTYLYAIIGYPMETKEEALKTLAVKKNNDKIVDTLFIHNFWLDKKAPAYKKRKAIKIKEIKNDNSNIITQSCKFVSEQGLTKEDMEELNTIYFNQNEFQKYSFFAPDEYFFLYAIHFGRNKFRNMLKEQDTNS